MENKPAPGTLAVTPHLKNFFPRFNEWKNEKFFKMVAAVTVVGAVGVGVFYLLKFARVRLTPFGVEKMTLKNQISEKYANSKDLVKLTVSKTHTLHHGDITVVFNIIDNLSKKPTAAANKTSNPFWPPFVEDLYITDVGPNHRVFLNKFCLSKNHVVLATRGAEKQVDPLNASDFAAAYKVMSALNGFAFYNCGPASGSSVSHKHLQIIPVEHFSNTSIIDEFDQIALGKKDTNQIVGEGDEEVEICRAPFYSRFRHILIRLPKWRKEEKFESYGLKMVKAYQRGLKILDNESHEYAYNVIFNENWIFIVLRSKEKALSDQLSVNSIGFLGSFLLRNEDMMLNIHPKAPLALLDEITVPAHAFMENTGTTFMSSGFQ